MSQKKQAPVFPGGVYFANIVGGSFKRHSYLSVRIIIAAAGVFGVLFCFSETFAISFSKLLCIFGCALAAAPVVLAAAAKKNKPLLLLAGTLVLFLWGFLNRHELIPGILGIYNRIVLTAEPYYIMPPLAVISFSETDCGGVECMERVFYLAAAIITYVTFIFTVFAPSFIGTFAVTAPAVIFSLYLKPVEPESLLGVLFALSCWTAAAVMEYSGRKITVNGANPILCRDRKKPKLYLPTNHHTTPAVSQLGAAAVSLILIAGCLAPLLRESLGINHLTWSDFEELGRKTEEKLGEIAIGQTSDLIGMLSSDDISLGNVDKADYRGKVDLVVTSDLLPEAPIYLRSNGGCEYTGDSWEYFDEKLVEPYAAMFDRFENGGYYTLIADKTYGEKYFPERKAEITVKNRLADRSKAYLPYFSDLSDKSFPPELDLYASPEKRSEYSVSAYLLSDNQINLHAGIQRAKYENSYMKYIEEMYLRLPENGLDRLRSDWVDVKFGNYTESEKILLVKYYLAEHATYTREPGRVPAGKDFVDYFLYENQKGYCVYFATAGAVILREIGVPARYAQGYVIFPGEWEERDGVYEAKVLDRSAHAWTEVYMKGIGWVPAEMTPASSLEDERREDPDATSETEPETEIATTEKETDPSVIEIKPPKGETTVPDKETYADSETSAAESPELEGFPVILWAVLVIFLIAAVRGIALASWNRSFTTKSHRKNILNMYRWFAAVSKALGLPRCDSSTLPAEYMDEFKSKLLPARLKEQELLSDGSLERFLSLAWKADFSREISESEAKEAYSAMKAFRRCLKSALKPWLWLYLSWLRMMI